MTLYYQDERVTLYHGDCRDVLREEARRRADYLDAPPMYPEGYEHGFIEGARWSRQQVARVEREACRRGQADALREASEDRSLRLAGHSGVSVRGLRARADSIEKGSDDDLGQQGVDRVLGRVRDDAVPQAGLASAATRVGWVPPEHGFIEGARWSRQQVARVEREAYRRGQVEAADRLKRIADLEPDQATFTALAIDNGIDYADGYLAACIVARDIAEGNH